LRVALVQAFHINVCDIKQESIDFIQVKDIPEEEDYKVGTSPGNLTEEVQKHDKSHVLGYELLKCQQFRTTYSL
jgi:hypothetical protein